MASLNTLLSTKRSNLGAAPEQNLESGDIYVYTSGGTTNNMRCKFCWVSPAAGRVVIEIWGAAGSGATMCCCGGGVSGNAPAYSKKTMNISANTYICGCVGYACGNASTLCFRGCSLGTCISVCDVTANTCTCMCAMGARGGFSVCHDGGSMMCCLGNIGLCITPTDTGCGWICNAGVGGYTLGQAYGGDVNCPERVSCSCYGTCYSQCRQCQAHYLATPSGLYSTGGGYIQLQEECTNGFQIQPGPMQAVYQGLAGMTRAPIMGNMPTMCWSSVNYCQCYEMQGCHNIMPAGIPGITGTPCSSIRDHGVRGGHGIVRIKWTATT